MFGYAFDSRPTPDRVDRSAAPYRHPQSFYFSGFPKPPANAPIVSQNYTNFAMIKPDPKTTWDQVNKLDPKNASGVPPVRFAGRGHGGAECRPGPDLGQHRKMRVRGPENRTPRDSVVGPGAPISINVLQEDTSALTPC